MTWQQALARSGRFAIRALIHAVAFVDHRIYMRLYRRYLGWIGVRMSGRGPKYVAASASLDGTDLGLIALGEDCVVSSGVLILTHDFSPARRDNLLGDNPSKERKKVEGVEIGDNAFVGARSVLLPGTRIGRDAIVGAGSVVRGKVQSGEIYYRESGSQGRQRRTTWRNHQ